MYHHRYQPPPHLANKNANTFDNNNYSINSTPSFATNQSNITGNASLSHNNSSSSLAQPGNIVSSGGLSAAPANNLSSGSIQSLDNSRGSHCGGSGQLYTSTGLPKQFIEERQDVIFRKVRGILNKITPETFDKLSKELVNVGLDSPRTLRGLIYLLFDKALKDLKYSSLYAKLCQELSEKAPNFEQEPGPNTFCKFLISKCEDEFERRRKATEDFDGKNELTDEEFEQKAIAKQKMLGNIKFICELGKKRLLQEEILHECIRGLLSKKKERPIQDQAQDLECLCQIMRTIGSLLDIQTSRNLMNQYFERIDMFSKKPELPSRIRFMLRDVIDLRNNNWRPRPFQREDNVPQPLSKLREEAGYDASTGAPMDKLGNNKNLLGDLSKMHASKLSSLLVDDEPGFTTTTDFHWGPTFMPHESPFDMFASSSMTPTRENSAFMSRPATLSNSLNKPPETLVNSKLNRSTTPTNILGRQQFSAAQQQRMASSQNENAQHHFDPFGDLAKSRFLGHNRSPIINNNAPTLQQDNHLEAKRPTEYQRNIDGRGFRNPPPHPSHMNNHDNAGPKNFRQDRESSFTPHYRDNNAPHLVGQPPKPQQLRDPDQAFGTPRKYEPPRTFDTPRPQAAHLQRGISPPPGPRNNPVRRPSNDMLPPPVSLSQPSGPVHANPPPPFAQPPARDQRFDQRNMHVNDGGFDRERRFSRPHGDHHPHEPRPPKFSGRNYRLPGRDRPGPIGRDNEDRANQLPESDSNMNWRSPSSKVGIVAANASPAANVHDAPNAQQAMNKDRPENGHSKPREVKPARFVDDLPGDLNSKLNLLAEQRNFSDRAPPREQAPPNRIAEDQSLRNRYVPAGKHARSDSHPDSAQSRFTDQMPHKPSSMSRNTSNEFGPPQQHPGSRTRQNLDDTRPPHLGDNPNSLAQTYRPAQRVAGHHAGREAQNGRIERDNRRVAPHNRTDLDRSQHGKKPEREPNFSLERNYKPPPTGRHQSFEGQTNSNLDRAPNWRRDTFNLATGNSSSLNSNNSKEQSNNPASISTPLFPKTPTKMSDANFSLRPSHNLIGRSMGASAIPAAVVVVAQQTPTPSQVSQSKDQLSDVKKDLPANDVSGPRRQNPDPVQNSPVVLPCKKESEFDQKEQQQSTQRNAAKEFHVNKFLAALSEYSNESPSITLTRLASNVKELKIPKSYQDECIVSAIKQSIVRSEADRESISKVLVQLVPAVFESAALLGAFRTIFEQLHGLEVETPRIKSLVAGFLSRAVIDGLLTLEEVAGILHGGKHHPLFLLFLQKLDKSAGQAWLCERFLASKINLMEMLPEVDRTNERLATSLKDRCLGFLDPMLTVEPDLWVQMKANGLTPNAVYRWIKENVDQAIQNAPTFAHVLIKCLLRYIHEASSQEKANANVARDQQKDSDTDGSGNSSKSSPTTSTSQTKIDTEKELLSKYQQVLQAVLSDTQMQLATLYALQSFYHGLDFPKGALLRWFHMLYDLNIVDDEVFFIWKEEINDEIPGKGQALFQVNTWLNWLAEAESEEEEEEEA